MLFLEATRRAADRAADPPPRPRARRRRRDRPARPGAASCSTSAPVGDAGRARRAPSMAPAWRPGGEGRFGLWTRHGGALPDARGARRSSRACRRVARPCAAWTSTLLGRRARAARRHRRRRGRGRRGRLHEVRGRGRRGGRRRTTASTPRSCSSRRRSRPIEAVARDGDVMPQKSTYFYPKALTGLVINPHEW